MPIYDLVCTTCGYEKGETIFPSYTAFKKAEKERECPECSSKLEARIAGFNTKGKRVTRTTDGKIEGIDINLGLGITLTPCGKAIPSMHVDIKKGYHKDPELN